MPEAASPAPLPPAGAQAATEPPEAIPAAEPATATLNDAQQAAPSPSAEAKQPKKISAREFFAIARYAPRPAALPKATATLESESVFFTRIEWQARINRARESARRTQQRIDAALWDLNLSVLANLHNSIVPKMSRALEGHELATRSVAAAMSLLDTWHRQESPVVTAIASGQWDAAPLYLAIRRAAASTASALATSARNYREAKQELDAAAATLKALKVPEQARPHVAEAARHIEAAAQMLQAAMADCDSARDVALQVIRNYFPACRDNTPGCQGQMLKRLAESKPAAAALARAYEQLQQASDKLDSVAEQVAAAFRAGESADESLNPQHSQVRAAGRLARQRLQHAIELLDQAEQQLTADCGQETVSSEYCLRSYRVRKVIEPAQACARAAQTMAEVQKTLLEAQGLVKKMESLLAGAAPAPEPASQARRQLALNELHGRVGSAVDEVAEAIQHAQQFRQGEFEHYQAEAYLRPRIEPKPRQFAPTIAFYAARQTWYYAGYFDDPALERDGRHFGLAQPVVSYCKFLVDLAMVPYRFVAEPPWEPQYSLRYHRPGDRVPHIIYLPKWNKWAAVFEGTVWALGLSLIP